MSSKVVIVTYQYGSPYDKAKRYKVERTCTNCFEVNRLWILTGHEVPMSFVCNNCGCQTSKPQPEVPRG